MQEKSSNEFQLFTIEPNTIVDPNTQLFDLETDPFQYFGMDVRRIDFFGNRITTSKVPKGRDPILASSKKMVYTHHINLTNFGLRIDCLRKDLCITHMEVYARENGNDFEITYPGKLPGGSELLTSQDVVCAKLGKPTLMGIYAPSGIDYDRPYYHEDTYEFGDGYFRTRYTYDDFKKLVSIDIGIDSVKLRDNLPIKISYPNAKTKLEMNLVFFKNRILNLLTNSGNSPA
jgi:hypothetical protein